MDDIGDVMEDAETTTSGEIDSVFSSATFHKCKLCNSKVDIVEDRLGRCTESKALSKLQKCPVTTFAKILVSDKAGYNHTLSL